MHGLHLRGGDLEKDAVESTFRQRSDAEDANTTIDESLDEFPLQGSLSEKLEQIARNLNKVIQQHRDLTSEQQQEQESLMENNQ